MSQLPTWAADPSRVEALDEVEVQYLQHCIEKRLAEMGKTMKDLPNLSEAVRTMVIDQAMHMMVQLQGEGTELLERASIHSALKVMRSESQKYDRDSNGEMLEDESFPAFLERKWGEYHSPGTISEITFFLELCVTFYSQGQGEWIEKTFRVRKNLGKLLKSTSVLKEKNNEIFAIKSRFKEQIAARIHFASMLYAEAEAESDEGEKEKILARRENVKVEIDEIRTRRDEVVADQQKELMELIETAAVMSQMEEVRANPSKDGTVKGIKQLLKEGVKVRKVKQKDKNTGEMVELPDTYELDYPELPPLPDILLGQTVVHKMYVNSHVAYVIQVPTSMEGVFEHAISTLAEVQNVDALFGIRDLIKQSSTESAILDYLTKTSNDSKDNTDSHKE